MSTDEQALPESIYEISANDLDGNEVKLRKYFGKCMLIVNIASDCKMLKQNINQLRALAEKFRGGSSRSCFLKQQSLKDFVLDCVVLLFPSNQFMGMPEKTSADIKSFLSQQHVYFAETFSKVEVNGPSSHPLFKFLKRSRPGCISWNFTKFLVSKSGEQIERFNHLIRFPVIEAEVAKMI